MIKLISKEEQQIRAIFGGRFVENKPIPFPDIRKNIIIQIYFIGHI